MKNILVCPHPYNPNLQINMELEDEFELIEGKPKIVKGARKNIKDEKKKKKSIKNSNILLLKEPKNNNNNGGDNDNYNNNNNNNDNNDNDESLPTERLASSTSSSPILKSNNNNNNSNNNNSNTKDIFFKMNKQFPHVANFIALLADAKAIKSDFLLFQKNDILQELRRDNFQETFDDYLRILVNDQTYGCICRSFESIAFSFSTITLEDLIKSEVTRNNFAIYCALMSRQQTGGSAQPGVLYASGMSYNLHGGMQHRNETAKRIACLKMWFNGLQKSVSGQLYYMQSKNFNW
jgi:hypothetical protein